MISQPDWGRRSFLKTSAGVAGGAIALGLTGCRKGPEGILGQPAKSGQIAALSGLESRKIVQDVKSFPHPRDETSSWRAPDGSKLYGLVNPTLTLVKEPDSSGVLVFYATITWQFHSYGWSTYYNGGSLLIPNIAIKFMSIDDAGHVGFPYRWDLGQHHLHCSAPDAFFKTTIEPNIFDITKNWWPDFTVARFFKVC